MKKPIFLATLLTTMSLFLTVTSCNNGKIDPFDKISGLSKEDTKDILIRRTEDEKSKNNKTESAIPEISKSKLRPPSPVSRQDILNGQKIISFSVTDEVPIKDILIELGRSTNIDVEIDPKITGSIVLSAYKRPFGEVVQRIATLANLRYSYENGVLRFGRDSPYSKNYFVDYLDKGRNLWSEVQANVNSIIKNEKALVDSSSNPIEVAGSSVTINKTAGIMTVFATQRQHHEIKKYLSDVARKASAQVLIEAKVVEVRLDDEYRTGINWNFLDATTNSGGQSINLGVGTGFDAEAPFTAVLASNNLGVSVSALKKFGLTKTISSPRIHAINNKEAVLKFLNKLIYFEIQNTSTNTGGANNAIALAETITSTKVEQDVGVELFITPSIDSDSGEVTLNIRPKISAKSGEVEDPASPVVNGEVIRNLVPIIQTREIDTIAKVQSGNVLVIGGLMQENTINVDQGVPFLQDIPILGNLFKSVSKDVEVVETVIFIKATIVNSRTQPGKVDKDIQERFDLNKRKFF